MINNAPSVILLEFNELTPRLLMGFMRAGHLPNFKRFYEESRVYVTDAEENGDNLQPWVQWVTTHAGLSAIDCGIATLSDGHRLDKKAIWDLISEAGFRVWVCGSMNARFDQPLNGYLLPDPWSTGLHPYPNGEFDSYYTFVRKAVQEHTNDVAPVSKKDALWFVGYMLSHGLSWRTMRFILKQLWTEKVRKTSRWKRAALLDHLQWDVFRRYYWKLKPHFSTFFINSTAHYQHSHWREMEPAAFEVKPSKESEAEYKDAILFGYQNMDELLGKFTHLADKETTLIFCTALSQQPYADADRVGGRHYYRVKSPTVFSEQLGVRLPFTFYPVMAEQFALRLEEEASATKMADFLGQYRIGERSVFHITQNGADLMVQCTQTKALPEATLIRAKGSEIAIPFFDIFYEMANLKSGHHHPDGMLWVRLPDRKHSVATGKVSLRSIAPAILAMYDLPRPAYMTCEPFMDEWTLGSIATPRETFAQVR